MSVFKEKNGRFDGAIPLCSSTTARRFTETSKTHFETDPCRFSIGKGLFFHVPRIGLYFFAGRRYGEEEVTTRTKAER